MPIHWTKKTRARILPSTLADKVFAPSPETLLKYLTEEGRYLRYERWRAGIPSASQELKEAMPVVLDVLQGQTLPTLDDTQLMAFVAVLRCFDKSDKNESRRVDLVIGAFGPVRALRAFVRANPWKYNRGVKDDAISLVRKKPADYAPYGCWIHLRKRLLQVTTETREALQAEAAELREGLPLYTRCMLTFLFPDRQDWVEEDFQACLDAKFTPECSWGPAICSQEPERLARFWKENFWRMPVNLVWTLLDKIGDRAAWGLMEYLGYADQSKVVLEALSCLGSPKVAAYFAVRFEKRRHQKHAMAFFKTFPRLAFHHLPSAKGGEQQLAGLVAEYPELASEALESAPESASKVLARLLRDNLQEVAEADPSELPRWLLNPPWAATSKTKKPKKKVWNLTQLEYGDRVELRPELYQEELEAAPDADEDYALKDFEEEPGFHAIYSLTDATALQLFNSLPAENWARVSWDVDMLDALRRLGLAALPAFLSFASRFPDQAASTLSQIDSPKVAHFWAEQLDGKRQRKAALEWFSFFPRAAAIGLIPLFLDSKGKARRIFQQGLNAVRCCAPEGEKVVQGVAADYGPDVEEAVSLLLGDLMSCHPPKVKALPEFWAPQRWARPALKNGSGAFPLEAMESLGQALSFPLPFSYPGLAQVQEVADCDEFLWALYGAWEASGSPSKWGWAMRAMGALGGSGVARELAKKIKDWPSKGLFARAVTGLDVLEGIGTDEALMYLDEFSKILKSEALRFQAKQRLRGIANRRGLSEDELRDRLVPTLGLEANAPLRLDFGPRAFLVEFNGQLELSLSDESGKTRKSLPKAGKNDDPGKAKQATARWRGLKKDVKKVAKLQLERLELAMVRGRHWTESDFHQFLVAHPLMVHLTRRLVWGVYGTDGLETTFRVAEDGTLADAQDEEYRLPESSQVGVVHPLDLGDNAWGELFADYELLQPFPQLDREVYKPTEAEASSTTIDRQAGTAIEQKKLFRLKNRGWRQGPVEDGPAYTRYYREFGGELSAVLSFSPGVYVGSGYEQDQTLDPVDVYHKGEPTPPSPTLFSELVRDLEALVAP